ncbi:LytR/AlgR family response regulator transcription factor [Bacillus suaedaesalsae]|uniref:Response regulator transcription factor n=1 Tax=Bacillus suaedaesalsae TaxID=2810349 RepID=A0ABS2DJH9_9BACI|nr:LytTR family DNA-binding domain-containing protein [Bacillus suaedaesalsae]MBM6618647.1 response regulator transcription factor [Bacillus suaedaesalsae]
MEKLKIVIADDESTSRILLHHFIKLLPDFEIIDEAKNGEELINTVIKVKPDIVLVDINMPGFNGLEAVKICKGLLPTLQVIFTTGYNEYAVDAFNISATDYVTKPIDRTRLSEALGKAKINFQTLKSQHANQIDKKITIKSGQTFLYINLEDILFIEKEGRKTVIHTRNQKVESNDPLHEFENKLHTFFYKTHRSYLVNLKQVTMIEAFGESYIAHFTNSNKTAQISRLKLTNVQQLLTEIADVY